jgi:hypothetical protein
MGGDDSQKLLPWRGAYSSPGRSKPASLQINTLAQGLSLLGPTNSFEQRHGRTLVTTEDVAEREFQPTEVSNGPTVHFGASERPGLKGPLHFHSDQRVLGQALQANDFAGRADEDLNYRSSLYVRLPDKPA